MPQYRRLTQSDRHLIEAMHRHDDLQKDIAQKVGCSPATICRELKRNGKCLGYRSVGAQRLADKRRRRCRRKKLIAGKAGLGFHRNLKKGLSPELHSGWLRTKFRRAPSTSTFYRYARAMGWSRYLLPRSGRRGAGRYIQRQKPPGRLSIDDRPKGAIRRLRYGHWERDTLYGEKGKLILVLIERKSRFLLIAPLRKRSAKQVTRVTRRLLDKTSLPVRTITNDNGSEFNDSESLDVPVYFCTPGKPYQRGAVENVNRMLRRYFPRKCNPDRYAMSHFRKVQNIINNRPRKCLGFRSAAEIMAQR